MAWSFSLVLHLGFLPSFSLSIVGFLILGYHSSVQCRSVVSNFCNTTDCSTLPDFTQTNVHWVSDAIQPSHPLSSPSAPTFKLSSIRVFSSKSVLHIRWTKYWRFSFNINPCNENSGLISLSRVTLLQSLITYGTSYQHFITGSVTHLVT